MIDAPARVDRNVAGLPVRAVALRPVPIIALPDWNNRVRWAGQRK